MDNLHDESQFKKMQQELNDIQNLYTDGTEEDEMPTGIGEFGLEVMNPVPVNSILGSMVYLRRLRTLDGIKVRFERIGSMRARNIARMIDGYKITVNEKEIAIIYICPYNKKISAKAPKGFVIAAN